MTFGFQRLDILLKHNTVDRSKMKKIPTKLRKYCKLPQ